MSVENFGTRGWPIRPSSVGQLMKCSMSVLLKSLHAQTEGNPYAATGSAVHHVVEVFHRTVGDPITRREAAVASVSTAMAKFPDADPEKVNRWYAAYLADPKNLAAEVRWLEEPVELEYDGVFFKGTLDQVRNLPKDEYLQLLKTYGQMDRFAEVAQDARTHFLTVWDVKTGVSLDAQQAVDEYQFQQAVYVMAARATLDATIEPGGLIFMSGYDKPRGQRFVSIGLDAGLCEALVKSAVARVKSIRAGNRDFTPSSSACAYCPFKRYPKCVSTLTGVIE